MMTVYDFCSTCMEGTTLKLSYYKAAGGFIVDIIIKDAKKGREALGVAFGYATIESIRVSDDVICCNCYVY